MRASLLQQGPETHVLCLSGHHIVLDGFGGLHGYAIAGGVPLPITGAPYWPGWSIARGLAI